jgi:UDP-GlcNAc:undecaprenyl-phosphate GlcNAc-1-phosphate transferase
MGAVDRPGPRKIHAAPIPRSGGLAVIGAVTLVSAFRFLLPDLSPALPREVWTGIGVGLLPILAVSIRDDIRPLGSGPKFAAHFLGAAIAVWLGVSVSNEIHMFGRTISIGLFSIPISMLWLVGLTNAFTVDGLDGLSAGLGLISSLSLGAVFVLTNQTDSLRLS